MLESIGIVVKIRNHWNDSYLSFDDSLQGKPKVFSSILNPKLYQEWFILPGLGSFTIFGITGQAVNFSYSLEYYFVSKVKMSMKNSITVDTSLLSYIQKPVRN